MESLIHYIKNGRSFGPVSVRDFLELLDRQVLDCDDLVRIDGDGRWQRAGLIAEQLRTGQLKAPSTPPAAARGSKRASAMPPGGSNTVFTSAPPIPSARVPRELAGLLSAKACQQCGTLPGPDAVFCKGCGTRLAPRACAACQHQNDPDARFCERCGQRLE